MSLRSATRIAAIGLAMNSFTCAWAQHETAATPPPPPTAATQPASGPSPHLELNPKEFNFGEIWQGMPATREFTIKNTGEAPLTVSASSSCGCTVATPPKSPLPPGETTTFTITYDTKRPGGEVQKMVTLRTNDPAQAAAEIKVSGSVKALFAATPREQLFFSELEISSKETQRVKLENKFDRPLKLKLKEGQDFGTFDVELKEIKEGMEYELEATTRPPLKMGFNRADIVVETGFDKVPTITFMATANAQPRVMIANPMLVVTPTSSQPTEQYVRLQYRVDKPVKITEVKPSLDSIKCEIMPPGQAATGQKTTIQMVKVTLPKFDELPEDGAKLEIFTDDKDPEYQKFEVPITKRGLVASTRPAVIRPMDAVKPAAPPSAPKPEPQ